MKLNNDEIKFLNKIEKKNVDFMVSYSSFGQFKIDANTLVDFLKDADQCMANSYGVKSKGAELLI